MNKNALSAPVQPPISEDLRSFWLTEGRTVLDETKSVLDPSQVGLRSREGTTTTIPGVFEMQGPEGSMDRFAVVRSEDAHGNIEVALRGLKQTKRGGFKVARKKVLLNVPEKGDNVVEVGNNGDVTREQLFGRGLFESKAKAKRFNAALGSQALKVTVNHAGGILVGSTSEESKVVRATMQRLNPDAKASVKGQVRIDDRDKRSFYYKTDMEHAEEARQARIRREQESDRRFFERAEQVKRHEKDRVDRVFAPRNVPDLTDGDRLPPNYEGLTVTPASRQYAHEQLSKAYRGNSRFAEIIAAAGFPRPRPNHPEDADRIIDAVRTNGDLRLKLGKAFQARIEGQVDYMGDNIKSKNWKKPSSRGYEEVYMKGPEYAAVLALSMLDGTFNPQKESVLATAANLNSYGWPTVDQHRAAARYAIDGLTERQRMNQRATAGV